MTPSANAAASHRKRPAKAAPATLALMGTLAAIACFLLLGFSSLVPAIVAPLLAGVLVGLTIEAGLSAALVATAGGATAGFLAGFAFQPGTFMQLASRTPPHAKPDLSVSFERLLVSLAFEGPAGTGLSGAGGALALAAVCALVAGGAAFGVRRLVAGRGPSAEPWVAWGAFALLAISFSFTVVVNTAASGFVRDLSSDPVPGRYAFDPVINQKTVYLMRRGDTYYAALVKAAAGDARLIQQNAVVSGRIAYPSAANIREPFTFYLLTAISLLGGVSSVLYASMLLCIAVMALYYRALRPLLGYRALFAPLFVFPSLLLLTSWYNVLHPDWWATLAVLFAVAFLALDRPIVGGAFVLAACLMRETMVLWAVVLVAVACVRAYREKSWKVPLIYAGMLGTFVAAFAVHLRTASNIVTAGPTSTPFFAYIAANATRGLVHGFLAPTSYLMLPYGFYSLPEYLLVPLGAAGFYFAFADRPWARASTLGFMGAEALYYLTFGATSSYWGQHVMPLAVIGTAALLCVADRAFPSVRRSAV